MIKQHVDKVLSTEMDRKDFLKHVGLATVAVVGATSLFTALSKFGQPSSSKSSVGYGGSAYGK